MANKLAVGVVKCSLCLHISEWTLWSWAAVLFSVCSLILFDIHVMNWVFLAEELKLVVVFFFFSSFVLDIWVDRLQHNMTAWTWSECLLLKVLMIYSAVCEPEASAVMNVTSAPSERRELSRCETSAKKWDGAREHGNINQRGGRRGGEVSISSLHCWNSSAPVKTAALSRQWIGFKCLCAKASGGNINTS